MPSISSRPSASTMRAALRRTTGSGGARGLHLGIGQPDVAEAFRIPAGRLACFCWCRPPFGASLTQDPAAFDPLSIVKATMSSLDQFAQAKLDDLQRRHLRRALAETVREDGIWVERDGRRLLSFSCNDYLNLTQHPAIKQAATGRDRAIRRGLRRLAPGDRQPPALCRAGSAAGAASSRPRPPWCSAPAISPMPASSRC